MLFPALKILLLTNVLSCAHLAALGDAWEILKSLWGVQTGDLFEFRCEFFVIQKFRFAGPYGEEHDVSG